MKLWHDDIRLPPDDTWTWARTNAQARGHLRRSQPVTVISLDHDMGLHAEDPTAPGAALRVGQSEETGMTLVKWMCSRDLVPPEVIIHSMNAIGADNMQSYLDSWASYFKADVRITVAPYRVPIADDLARLRAR